jgi:hypothetical protein
MTTVRSRCKQSVRRTRFSRSAAELRAQAAISAGAFRPLLIACVSAVAIALVGAIAVVASAGASTRAAAHVDRWPFRRLQLGITSPPGAAAGERRAAPLALRYAYLSGGVNTGNGWRTWANGNGDYVSEYIAEAERAHMIPVFSYYQLLQSQPGDTNSNESSGDLQNLGNVSTMRSYYGDLTAFFKEAASAKDPVILQVEPDLWGYIEQASGGNAEKVPAAVASTKVAGLKGLPNNASGFARAILTLRDRYAPHVIVAYHDSIWGTGFAIQESHPSNSQVTWMAKQSVSFYKSLHAKFNAIFTETSNSDAGYAQVVEGAGRSQWWAPVDFEHLREYIGDMHKALKLPTVIWQIPVGNSVMRVMNNTPYHYQDNTVQSLLGTNKQARALINGYAAAGVSALLFGSPQPTDTCGCDNDHNKLGNEPKPIDGNTRRSYTDADDGGYFMHVAKAYYRRGPVAVK